MRDRSEGHTRRRRWPWVLAGSAAALATVIIATAHLFQFGVPGTTTDADRNHVYVAEDGTHQHYRVHLPPSHDTSRQLPVMMALHGCGMTGFGWNSMRSATRFDDLADAEGFIVVYPTQRRFESLLNCWNSADPGNQVRGQGEPALLAGVAEEVSRLYGADRDRIHVSGASSGAGAAVVLGATYPDVFATVTSVAGGEYGLNQVDPGNPAATPPSTTARQAWAQMGEHSRRVPMLVVQGGADEVVPSLVGERLVEQWVDVNDFADDELLNDSLGLTRETQAVDKTAGRYAYETTTIRTGDGSTMIEYLFVPALGHAWPGPEGEGTYTDRAGPDASMIAWRFAERAAP